MGHDETHTLTSPLRARVTVPARVADDFAGLVMWRGAAGTELRIAEGSPDAHRTSLPMLDPKSPDDPVVVVATFESDTDETAARATLDASLEECGLDPQAVPYVLERADERDWVEQWKEFFPPMDLGPLWVVPPWHRSSPPSRVAVVVIDPGMAFGTGQHATTRLCLERVVELAPTRPSTLDVGTGSGILAISAAKLGARQVVGTDTDLDARNAAALNAQANGVDLEWVDAEWLERPDVFDHVVANILANTLIELAAPLVRHTAPAGALTLSGVLVGQVDSVQAAFDHAMQAHHRRATGCVVRVEGEWAAINYRLE